MEIWKKEAIAKRFKDMREKCGLLQSDVAKKAFMSQSAISSIESGDRSIKAEELPLLAEVLGTTAHEIVTGEDPSNITTCKDLHLSSQTIDRLHNMRDPKRGIALDTLVADEFILEQMYYYLYWDYNTVQFWEHESGEGYVREVPVSDLMGSIPKDALAEIKLMEIVDHLRKIREGAQNGKHQKAE